MLIRFSTWTDHHVGDYLVWITAGMAALAICVAAYFTSEPK